MRSPLPTLAVLGAALLGTVAASSPANAQAGVELGLLSCVSEGSVGYVIGSSENLTCTFDPANSAAVREVYVGTIDTIGLDIGVTGPTTMRWLVLSAAADTLQPGVLAGRYTGASANASLGIGAGVNILGGGFQNSIALQPVSVQAQEGLNAAIGVSSFRLAPVAAIAPAPAQAGSPPVVVR